MVTVKFNSHQLKMFLNATEMRQVDYAISRAMNDSAMLAVHIARVEAKKKLTIRKPGWFEKGISFIPSNKKVKPISVTIYSKSDWAAKNEDDQTSKMTKGKKLTKPWMARENPKALIKKSMRAANLLEKIKKEKLKPRKRKAGRTKRRQFVIRLKDGRHAIAIRQGEHRHPLAFYYFFEKEIKWNQKFKMEVNVKKMIESQMPKAFKRRFEEAMRTARK